MWAHIEWNDGSNPYVALHNETFEEVCYGNELKLLGFSPARFLATNRRNIREFGHQRPSNDYYSRKYFWRKWFIDFSDESVNFSESWNDVVEWTDFAEYIARKYGLVREFRENGIL